MQNRSSHFDKTALYLTEFFCLLPNFVGSCGKYSGPGLLNYFPVYGENMSFPVHTCATTRLYGFHTASYGLEYSKAGYIKQQKHVCKKYAKKSVNRATKVV